MRYLLLLALLACASGCTSITSTVVATSSSHSGEFKSIYIVYDDFIRKNDPIWNSDPNTAASAEDAIKKIGAQNLLQWPKQFSAQGIQIEFTTTGSQKQIQNFSIVLISAPRTDLDYDMMITLESVSPRWFGMYDVSFEATLRDRIIRTGEVLWKTNILLHKGFGAINERELSEELSNKLLSQLKRELMGSASH